MVYTHIDIGAYLNAFAVKPLCDEFCQSSTILPP